MTAISACPSTARWNCSCPDRRATRRSGRRPCHLLLSLFLRRAVAVELDHVGFAAPGADFAARGITQIQRILPVVALWFDGWSYGDRDGAAAWKPVTAANDVACLASPPIALTLGRARQFVERGLAGGLGALLVERTARAVRAPLRRRGPGATGSIPRPRRRGSAPAPRSASGSRSGSPPPARPGRAPRPDPPWLLRAPDRAAPP